VTPGAQKHIPLFNHPEPLVNLLPSSRDISVAINGFFHQTGSRVGFLSVASRTGHLSKLPTSHVYILEHFIPTPLKIEPSLKEIFAISFGDGISFYPTVPFFDLWP
jgi:hypothetical protein